MNVLLASAGANEAREESREPFRLPSGGLVDRTRVLHATFDDHALTGFAGDTLASALLASGERLVGAQLQVSPAARDLFGRQRRTQCAGGAAVGGAARAERQGDDGRAL